MDDFKQRHDGLDHADFQQWYLTPGQISLQDGAPLIHESFESDFDNSWSWIDPFKDSSYSLDKGLIIQAVNERNLYDINHSAPRIVYSNSLQRDFISQTICQTRSDSKPAIGGLLIWQNEKNWLCLEIGARGEDEVIFRGFKDNHDAVFGRGRLQHEGKVYLRLEKHGYQVLAFCSTDGENWFFVGRANIPSNEPLVTGIHAIGHINRLVYPGPYPQGTSIKFIQFSLWTIGEGEITQLG